MPQLDPSSFPSQLFWLFLSFGLLYFLLSRHLLPQVQRTLDRRDRQLSEALAEAKRIKAEAESMHVSYEQALTQARAEAHRLMEEAKARIQAEGATRQAELDRQIEEKINAAQARIRAMQEEASRSAAPAAAKLAEQIANLLAPHREMIDAQAVVTRLMTGKQAS
jgi:F-type H+-transporting ATPase subunit b